ncbi:MAG: homoserine O-succinyltransferase [Verrucomicrobiota bacterium]|nr:homoserine O-succinyltransferase [Verrucomicrobiota bacterium]
MTIRLSPNHRLKPLFDQHHVTWLSEEAAEHQDIRPLRIGVLNIMPRAEDYEFNLLAPMGRSILQIIPVWIRLNTHEYSSSDHAYLDKHYIPFDWAQSVAALDGLIVTGAPVEHLAWEEITYWTELYHIIDAAKRSGTQILGICWGGLALAKYLGIDKVMYPEKVFGVYPTRNLVPDHAIMGGLDDVFWCPQSRHSGIEDAVLEAEAAAGRIRLLAQAEKGGYVIFETPESQFMMHLGHQEYNSSRLLKEAARDREKGRADVGPLENLDPVHPINNWRANRNEFFNAWIKNVYLRTPYAKGADVPTESNEIVVDIEKGAQ